MSYLIEIIKKRIGTAPQQTESEIDALVSLLMNRSIQNVLEIGTAGGGTLKLWHQIANQTAKIISIDLPGGQFGGGYPLWKIPIFRSFKLSQQKQYLIRANSHDMGIYGRILRILGDEELDFLFIDGDHTYAGAMLDFARYLPLVRRSGGRSGGIVALHDIAPNPNPQCNVDKYWNEIKKGFFYKEFIDLDNPLGIGVVFL